MNLKRQLKQLLENRAEVRARYEAHQAPLGPSDKAMALWFVFETYTTCN